MLVLGLDTALQRCSTAILSDGEVLGRRAVGMERGHAEALAPMTAEVLAAAGIAVADLDRVGVVAGPGGFTGLRVALSFARGLALGTGVEVVGVSSLAALALNADDAPADALRAPVIDAKRGQVYAALYDSAGRALIDPFVADPERAFSLLADGAGGDAVALIGTGAALFSGLPPAWKISEGDPQISAIAVARMAAAGMGGPPAPLYLRAPDAKPPRAGSAIRVSE